MYKSKAKALDLFTNETSVLEFRRLYSVIKEVVTLPEYIQHQFSQGIVITALFGAPLIELIFNLHSIVGFRCRVPLLLASFLRATNGMRGWIRRPDFGLRGPDTTRRDNHPCSHRKAAELDRSDPETSRSSGAQPGASSHPESARTLPRKRQSWRGLPVVADRNRRARRPGSRSHCCQDKRPRAAAIRCGFRSEGIGCDDIVGFIGASFGPGPAG
jgi:hypothetical protein